MKVIQRIKSAPTDCIFEDKYLRNLTNCFRFTLKSYLKYKEQHLHDYSYAKGIAPSQVVRHVGLSPSSVNTVNLELAQDVCKYFNIEFSYLIAISRAFVNTEYNAMTFKEDGTVIFFKGLYIKEAA